MVRIPPPVLQLVMKIEFGKKLGRPECPYIRRWMIDLGPLGSLRLHHWYSSDDLRAKHDHPSDFITLVLKGGYTDLQDGLRCAYPIEIANCGICHGHPGTICDACGNGMRNERMEPGMIRRRSAHHQHSVKVDPGGCWTLLYFFPKRRNWGFWVPRKDNGVKRFVKSNKYFFEKGHHPCD